MDKMSCSRKRLFQFWIFQAIVQIYTRIGLLQGSNTTKSMLMHPQDKVDTNSLKKNIVYWWSCNNSKCKSSYIRETSRSLCEHVKEHSKEGSNSASYQHCPTKGHPLPNVDKFKVIDQEKSQIACEAKEVIHSKIASWTKWKCWQNGVFDPIFGTKPNNLCIASLLSQESGSQEMGMNLTQFHSFIDKRVTCSNRAQLISSNVFLYRHGLSSAIIFIN